jgi:hypothetical protein
MINNYEHKMVLPVKQSETSTSGLEIMSTYMFTELHSVRICGSLRLLDRQNHFVLIGNYLNLFQVL